ncbi:MAG: DUF1501 domain-containing protein [Planctomycetota bacterium]
MGTRRQFLKTSLAGSAVISLSGAVPGVLLSASRDAAPDSGEKILVVVQLSGGNDGLNTIVPFGDSRYYENRFTLAIGQNQVLKIDDHVGFHPAMDGMNQLLQDGKLGVVQGVGYPEPNRSHFESMDLWHTAHRIVEGRYGWLGRTLDANNIAPDLPAVHFGPGLQPLALRNENTPVPSIRSIDNFRLNLLRDGRNRELLNQIVQPPRDNTNELLGFIHDSANVAIRTSERMENINSNSQAGSGYPPTGLGRNLQAIARLIGSGLSTRIYYTTLDGFDTHSNQAAGHQGLLSDLSRSVSAFVADLEEQGNADRVALFSFSEFGRRVRENASAGTDHGTAGPVFVAGPSVKAGPLSEHPDLGDLQDGDMKFGVDYRRVYAGLLKNWLGVDPDPILGASYQPFELFD